MTIARTYALIIGWLLTAVGIVGFFFPAGLLLGVLEVNVLHNIVHVVTGLVALFFGYYMTGHYSRTFDQWLGIVYAIITVVGVATAGLGAASILGILPVNLADNVLHLAVAVTALAAGFLTTKEEVMAEEPTMRRAA